jgi:hypothetical protein
MILLAVQRAYILGRSILIYGNSLANPPALPDNEQFLKEGIGTSPWDLLNFSFNSQTEVNLIPSLSFRH